MTKRRSADCNPVVLHFLQPLKYEYVTLHRKISHNAGEEFLELARAGQSTFNQLSFGTKISFIPGSVPELRHFEVTEVKKSTMEKRLKTLIIAWVGVN